MAKIKLMHFALIAMLEDSKRLIDYLQRVGVTELADVSDDALTKYRTGPLVSIFEKKEKTARQAVEAVEHRCKIKRTLIQSLTDYTEIDYHQYRQLCEQADTVMVDCEAVNALTEEIRAQKAEIVRQRTMIDYYRPWESLDIPMNARRTPTTAIFIGLFKSQLQREDVETRLAQELPETDGISVEIISSSKLQTCCMVLCHHSDAEAVETALKACGFIRPDKPAKTLPSAAIAQCKAAIEAAQQEIDACNEAIAQYGEQYDRMRLLADYYAAQKEKYLSMEKAATGRRTLYLEGYVPERDAEQLKFDIEKRFTAQMELDAPELTDDVPVLIENRDFAGGVESITNMYAPPSNRDLDPNPVMAFFYYLLFGMMLSDAGYGILMVLVGLVAKYKIKVQGNLRRTASFALYCGVATTFWGVLFGGFFGNLIPTIRTEFLGLDEGPSLALWFEPAMDSIKLMLFSFLLGIIHLFTGLAIRLVTLWKQGDRIGAVCDTIPIYLFVSGFAVVGKDFIEPVSPQVKSIGLYLLLAGAVLIVLTAGRSAKNIFGKLGGGVYALYNNITGYLGDILSYSRLLALNLVTGVIALVVNKLGAMMGNIVAFIVIFLLGHTMNIVINLIGTYVHTCRLQFVEYFSKFYEGGGKVFTPFKFNLKHFKFKEDTINE